MRISSYFKLGRSQPTLDFVDVDVVKDTRVFVDPHAIRSIDSDFTDECISLIQSFFNEILLLAKAGDDVTAKALLEPLHEPNETHLGLSDGDAKGRALGPYLANEVWSSLKASKAVKTGLIEDLEDTLLLIDGIGPDLVSDISTNIIRGPLIAYTQEMCAAHGIELTPNVDSGLIWDQVKKAWINRFESLPIGPKGPLVFVPKAIVRKRLEYDLGEYYNHYILSSLQRSELSANTALVHIIKTKKGTKKKVYMKDVKKKFGSGKKMILDHSLRDPSILDKYRKNKQAHKIDPLNHNELAATISVPEADWDKLLATLTGIPAGAEHASEYENAVEALLTALFYPVLVFPKQQHRIHDDRKRIDITYSNTGKGAFFGWISAHYPSAKIMIECKNYSGEVKNPELDQLSGRFSPNRGKVGFLICRSFDNKKKFLDRCRDTALDQRGYVIPLDDADLKGLVDFIKLHPNDGDYPILRARFDQLLT